MSDCPHCGEPIEIVQGKRPGVPIEEVPPAATSILEQEAQRAGIPVVHMTGRTRKRAYVIARYRCAVRLRGMGLSYPSIGRLLNRDHTTIMDLLNKGPIYDGMEVSK